MSYLESDPTSVQISEKPDWHFLQRLYERYGIILSRKEVLILKHELRSGRIPLRAKGERDSNGYYVHIQGQLIPVQYNRKKDILVTALAHKSYRPNGGTQVRRQSVDQGIYTDIQNNPAPRAKRKR